MRRKLLNGSSHGVYSLDFFDWALCRLYLDLRLPEDLCEAAAVRPLMLHTCLGREAVLTVLVPMHALELLAICNVRMPRGRQILYHRFCNFHAKSESHYLLKGGTNVHL